MLVRCRNPNYPRFWRYGGRGIRVCKRWLTFANFLADMGKRPSPDHSLDRIDNDGNYEPGNCRWASRLEQVNNCYSNVRITRDGVTRTLAEWARITGLKHATLWARVKVHGMSGADVLLPIEEMAARVREKQIVTQARKRKAFMVRLASGRTVRIRGRSDARIFAAAHDGRLLRVPGALDEEGT